MLNIYSVVACYFAATISSFVSVLLFAVYVFR